MGKAITKENVASHKNHAINKISNLLESYINNSNPDYFKKANLLSYWIENFSDYIKNEERFNPKKLISYKRGDVIKANFGFNVGSELGGLHYAVVLDNDNPQSSPVVTVVPLSSGTAAQTHPKDVFIGNELYIKLNEKSKLLWQSAKDKHDTCTESLKYLKLLFKGMTLSDSIAEKEKINAAIDKLEAMQKDTIKDIDILKKYNKEVSRMKQGSIALIGQITTISKMRIYIPKKSTDILYGISLSGGSMEKVNKKLINFLLKENNS